MREQLYFTEEYQYSEADSSTDSDATKKLLRITKVNSPDEKLLLREKYLKFEVENNILERKKGAKLIFDSIVINKKKLIGHNCILDFMFFLSHFNEIISGDLNLFKSLMKSTFGETFDTKHLYNKFSKEKSINLYRPNLESIYNYFKTQNDQSKTKLTIKLIYGEDRYSKECYHEAAYDAFITGALFYYMKNLFGEQWMSSESCKFNMMNSTFTVLDINGTDNREYQSNLFLGIVMNKGLKLNAVTFKELYNHCDYSRRTIKSHKENDECMFLFLRNGEVVGEFRNEKNEKIEINVTEEEFKLKLHDIVKKLMYKEDLSIMMIDSGNQIETKQRMFYYFYSFDDMKSFYQNGHINQSK